MNKTEITLKKLRAICIKNKPTTAGQSKLYAATLNAEMVRLGFVMDQKLFEAVASQSEDDVVSLFKDVVAILKKMKGDDVKYVPMYKNFPKEVMETDHLDLYLNAITHYWRSGEWMPPSEEVPAQFAPENNKAMQISLCSEKEFLGLFTRLLSTNTSLSEYDKKVVEWYLKEIPGTQLVYPTEIPFKETLCLVATHLVNLNRSIESCVSNATDVLRVMTHLSVGDISLAENTKFRSLPKKTRRLLVAALEGVISAEDVSRHRNKWVRAFHSLHVGDYAKKYPKTFEVAKRVRSGEKIETFNSKVEAALAKNDGTKAAKTLVKRPGEFARRLDHVLRLGNQKTQDESTTLFEGVTNKISTRVLCQLSGHFLSREEPGERVVFPKGSVARAVMLSNKLPKLNKKTIKKVREVLRKELTARAEKMDPLGKVWVDPRLAKCPIPMQQRSASESLLQVARGTRLPMTDKPTLRFFIYWVGQDIDLSATLHDENFKMIEQISYTNLRSDRYKACHSGDITYAPNGAAEFIDITIDDAVKCGARYIAMNVYVFSGPNFSDHQACYAGWMTRKHPDKNEKFDPKTVEQKIDLRSESRIAIPVVFDLKERQGIWCDLTPKQRSPWTGTTYSRFGGNNVHTNRATIEQTILSIISTENKPNLYDLFTIHGEARGELVETREEADVTFGLDLNEDTLTPFHIDEISAEYLA